MGAGMYKQGMYKQMGSIKSPNHMSKKDLIDWWLNHHSLTGRLIPNLQFYTVNFTLDDTPFGPPPFDGYADNSFITLEQLKEGGTSKEMDFQIDDVKKYKLDNPELCQIVWAEEYIIEVPGGFENIPEKKGMYKQMGSIKCPPSMDKKQLKDWWLNKHAKNGRNLPGLKWYTVNFTLDDTPFGPPPFDGYAEIWFDEFETLKEAYNSDIMLQQMEDVKEHNLDNPEISSVVWAKANIINIPK